MAKADDFSIKDFDIDLIEGVAADSAAGLDELALLPRPLRYAIMASRGVASCAGRLAAEIAEICPGLAAAEVWYRTQTGDAGICLAAELDRRAVLDDRSELRGLADCVRILSLSVPVEHKLLADHYRVARVLVASLRRLRDSVPRDLAAEAETTAFGWSALPVCCDDVSGQYAMRAARAAAMLGAEMAHHRIAEAEALMQSKEKDSESSSSETDQKLRDAPSAPTTPPPGQVVVGCIESRELNNHRLRDVFAQVSNVINQAVPLTATPDLANLRQLLLAEFPYAETAIDFILADLVGHSAASLRPLLLFGPPGCGKSRFVFRLAHHLGVALWCTDATRDGAPFGGTDRRWATAQVCHPLLAIARAGHANPIILLDELDKATIGREYGRLFDCLLALLEPQTARGYPDPALQTTVDLRHVSYVATANSPDSLPAPLRDRLRCVEFRPPGRDDLPALLSAIMADILRDRGLDLNWMEPVTGTELEMISQYWQGGSVRQLRRIVEVLMRERENRSRRH